jgi:ferredoxin
MADIREYTREKEGSNISKIAIDRDLCISAVSCVAVAAELWELDDENKAVVTDANSVDDDTLMASAQACPTKAIFLYDKDGNQVWPV